MAEQKKSAVQQLHEKRAKEAREYKTSHDVDRLHHMAAFMNFVRDYPQTSPLAASVGRELRALALKQEDLDAKEKEEQDKEAREAMAADAKAANGGAKAEEGDDEPSHPTSGAGVRAPSVPRR